MGKDTIVRNDDRPTVLELIEKAAARPSGRWGVPGSLFLLLLAWVAISTGSTVHASPASPFPFVETQPDGSKVTLYIRGDERNHWLEDRDGYTVVKDRGAFVYGAPNPDGSVVPTSMRVGASSPAAGGLTPGLKPAPPVTAMSTALRQSAPSGETSALSAPQQRISPLGSVKNLVILIRFSNHLGRTLPSNADFNIIFNNVGPHALAPTGSVRDYYLQTSYGKLTLNSTVVGWLDLPNTEQYYADGTSAGTEKIWEAIISGLTLADATVDFDQFDADNDGFIDAITFIHSGYGAEWGGIDSSGTNYINRIWSHKWSIPTWTSAEGVKVSDYHISPGLWATSGTAPGRIGVICHETGHFFGLPDLYDYTAPGEGAGSWCLMANSWGFDGSQYYPPHMSGWSKMQLGWITPTIVTVPGTYPVPQSIDNEVLYLIANNFPALEYLLIENRQSVGFEGDMPQGGLAIWHIDDLADFYTQGYPGQSGWPGNGKHYRVALLQADGQYHLEKGTNRGDGGDVYRGGGVSTLSPTTVPNTNTYQGGIIKSTGAVIDQITASSANMSFRYLRTTDLTGSTLIFSPKTLDFGKIALGKTLTKNLVVYNISGVSQVLQPFASQLSGNKSFVTSAGTTQITIPANSSVSIPITFKAAIAGKTATKTLKIYNSDPSISPAYIKLKGYAAITIGGF